MLKNKYLLSIYIIFTFCYTQNPIDAYLIGNNTTTLRGTAQDGLITPRDLDFHKVPGRQDELWVINEYNIQRTHGGSTVTYYNAGQDNQWAEYRKDSWSGHFMHTASAIAISENGTFANTLDCQDANNQGGYFTGSSLWDSDTSVYARVHQSDNLLGSHIDMIHQSPYSEGIASAGGNVYWLFDGFHNAICKYDFGVPHQHGGDNHSDGRVWRHSEVAVDRVSGLSSHMAIDPVSGWLYIADTGNERILRMDPNSGQIAQNLTPYGEQLAGYWRMSETDWNIVADTDLTYPTGLDVYDNRLLVSDYANGDIIIYDITQDPVIELGRLETGLNNEIMGLTVSPEGKIWYVCTNANKLYQISSSVAVSLTIEHLSDWNLVGLPLVVEDSSYEMVYPNALSGTLYSFDNTGGYQLISNLIAGEGYWLRFPSVGSNIVTGIPFNSVVPYVTTGWNLISGISSTIAVESIIDPSGIIVPGTIYGFGLGYIQVDELEPGKGYWMRASGNGTITIQSGNAKQSAQNFIDRSETAHSLIFTNADGSVSQLHFGVKIPENEKLSYTLPPLPPADAFDVRYSGDVRVVDISGEIFIQNSQWPITVKMSFHNEESNRSEWMLMNSVSGEEYIFDETNVIQITGMAENLILQKRGALPEKFSLHQNYPNPFNPITSLRYGLPERAQLTLTVFDLMGRQITQLVNTTQDVGLKSVQWNATDSFGKPVSAGVYLYQIRAGEFVQTRKMVLLK